MSTKEIEAFSVAEELAYELSSSPHRWINPHAEKPCDSSGCMWCDGGLEVCDVCGAFEGATPTECPKRHLAAGEADAIYAGKLDFRCGAWQLRPTRWIETQRAFSERKLPEPLVLTGLPDVGDGPTHLAVYDPATSTSWCDPSCVGCAHAVRTATS